MQIFDSVNNRLGADIGSIIKNGSKLAVITACFSMYAFDEMRHELSEIEELRLILTRDESLIFGTSSEGDLRLKLKQKAISGELASWIRAKVKIKKYSGKTALQGCIIVDDVAYTPVDEFSTAVLGFNTKTSRSHVIVKDASLSPSLIRNFDTLWEDESLTYDIGEKVLSLLDRAKSENSPAALYSSMMIEAYSSVLSENIEQAEELTSHQESVLSKILKRFEKNRGCILAECKSLGKRDTALALIKHYELRNRAVLVLSSLRNIEKWQSCKSLHNCSFELMLHGDMAGKIGKSSLIDLSRMHLGSYDLVVIDEADVFCRDVSHDEDMDELSEGTAYGRFKSRLKNTPSKLKILMLSDSLLDKSFDSLKNQLLLALPSLSEEDELMLRAEKSYYEYLSSYSGDFNSALSCFGLDIIKLFDDVIVSTLRSNMENHVNSDGLYMPELLKGVTVQTKLSSIKSSMSYADIVRKLLKLNFYIYTPLHFIGQDKIRKYSALLGDYGRNTGLYQLKREEELRCLCALKLAGRLESSIYSFKLSLIYMRKLIDDVMKKIMVLGAGAAINVDRLKSLCLSELSIYDKYNLDMEALDAKFRIDISDMDVSLWKSKLESDLDIIDELRLMLDNISPSHDIKLGTLVQIIEARHVEDENAEGRKTVIFTAYEDTAAYLYGSISSYFYNNYSLSTALVKNNGDVSVTPGGLKRDINTLLTCFSPISRERNISLPGNDTDIDILITTDAITSGEELKDCDFLINYDILWNIEELAGRLSVIDGFSTSKRSIQMLSFFPDLRLDDYAMLEIKLRNLYGQIKPVRSTLSKVEMAEFYEKKAELEAVLEGLTDIEKISLQPGFRDITLAEMRFKFGAHLKNNDEYVKEPKGLYAICASRDGLPRGLILLIKSQASDCASSENTLYPYYFMYMDYRSEVVLDYTQHERITEIIAGLCSHRTTPYKRLCEHFNKHTSGNRNMGEFSKLLIKALKYIKENEKKDDRIIWENMTRTEAEGKQTADVEMTEFELISFLIIL